MCIYVYIASSASCIYVYICVYMCMYVYILSSLSCIYVYICVYMCLYVYISSSLSSFWGFYMCIYVYICVYMCIYVYISSSSSCIYVYICVYMCIYVYISLSSWSFWGRTGSHGEAQGGVLAGPEVVPKGVLLGVPFGAVPAGLVIGECNCHTTRIRSSATVRRGRVGLGFVHSNPTRTTGSADIHTYILIMPSATCRRPLFAMCSCQCRTVYRYWGVVLGIVIGVSCLYRYWGVVLPIVVGVSYCMSFSYICMYVYICLYMSVYVCIYVCMCVYVCI